MQLTYLGPLCAGLSHPVAEELDLERFPPSCYLVEVRDGAGVAGPIIEGEEALRLCRSHRIGKLINVALERCHY